MNAIYEAFSYVRNIIFILKYTQSSQIYPISQTLKKIYIYLSNYVT